MTRSIEEYRERLRGGTTRPLPDYPEGSPQKMCMDNDGLVWATVERQYATRDDDMIQAGRVGNLKAVEKFDPAKARYSTYATQWIWNLASLERSRRGLIHIPKYLRRSYPGGKHKARLAEAEAARAMRCHGIGREAGEVPDLESADSGEVADLELVEEIRSTVAGATTALWHLDRRLPEIMARRFGLDGREPETLGEIGGRFGVSKERARQIIGKGLEVLRVHFERSMAS
jgi:RNA polymerase primary sigma factor